MHYYQNYKHNLVVELEMQKQHYQNCTTKKTTNQTNSTPKT